MPYSDCIVSLNEEAKKSTGLQRASVTVALLVTELATTSAMLIIIRKA